MAFECSFRWSVCFNLVFFTPLFVGKDTTQVGVILAEKETFSRLTFAAIDAALEAGDILKHGFRTPFKISSKEGKHNLVTEYDHKAERAIIHSLKEAVPDSHFLAEESGDSGGNNELTWIIDPLDGTVNFAHKIPIFSVSIALEKKGEVVSGVVYQPLQNELFVAEKGKGAYLNGEPISVSPIEKIEKAFFATGFPYNLSDNPFHCIEHFIDILKLGIPIRRLGSAAIDLAYTAAGYYEGFFEVGLKPWDSAAGCLLIEEAGGKITHWDRSPFSVHSNKPILATNGKIHNEMGAILIRDKK